MSKSMTLFECWQEYKYRPMTEGERYFFAIGLSVPNDIVITDIDNDKESMRQILSDFGRVKKGDT